MNIIPIQNYQQNSNFKAKISTKKAKEYAGNYVSKKILEPRKISNKIAQEKAGYMEKYVLGGTSAILGIDLLLKEKGISYCESKDNTINLGGENGDFYQIKTSAYFSVPQAQEFIFRSLMGDPSILGGFINYKNMINDIGRQDIVKKGLKLFTYTLNNTLTQGQRLTAAKHLTKFTNIALTPENLFFIDSEAFFYDKYTKTVYGVNVAEPKKLNSTQAAFRTCTFKTDSNGKAIGYKVNDWNWYNRNYVDKEYTEQQEPSSKLPPIMELRSNKDIAEAFRFGNAKSDNRLQLGIPNVLKHLHEKAGITNVNEKDLQLIKYYNEGGHIERRIAYYNPSTGHSLVYDQEGKFVYQLEYNRDAFGNITACTKL